MNQEMEFAAQAHRNRIHAMTAIPPLMMDEDRLQSQTRCATLELQAEDLRNQLQAYQEQNDSGKIVIEKMRKGLEEQADAIDAMTKENSSLRSDKEVLKSQAAKVDSEFKRMKRAMKLDESEAEVNEKAMRGLKKRLETTEGELESLKRKRADSISPERVITGILKRPIASPPTGQDVPSSSAQPTPKKSRNRKDRWDVA